MEEKIEVWKLFHDGSIIEVKGDLPNPSLRIQISYLREIFPSKGDSFWAHFQNCTLIEYLNWEEETKERSLEKIAHQEPEILNVSQVGKMACIVCSSGELHLIYESIHFTLDSGIAISMNELRNASHTYWKAF